MINLATRRACSLNLSLSICNFDDLKIDSSLERFDFSIRISGVMKGLCGRDGKEEVLAGACLSSRLDNVFENC